jgi:hypothetical protein
MEAKTALRVVHEEPVKGGSFVMTADGLMSEADFLAEEAKKSKSDAADNSSATPQKLEK